MAEWFAGSGETKVARNVPTPSPLSSPVSPTCTYLLFILFLVGGAQLVLPLHRLSSLSPVVFVSNVPVHPAD